MRQDDASRDRPGSPATTGDSSSVDGASLEPGRAGPLRLDAAVLGGATFDPAPGVVTGTGALLVRGAIGRWGLVLDGAFDSGRAQTREGVTVAVAAQWLSLAFSVGFMPSNDVSLDVALGVRGWRFAATAQGTDAPVSRDAFTAGGVLSAGVGWRVWGPVHLHARPFASLRVQPIHFTVDPLGVVVPVELWTVGALAGALVRFE